MILQFYIKKGSCVSSGPLRTLNYRLVTEQFNLLLHLPECCALLFITNLQMKPRSEFEMLKLRYPQTYKANERIAMRKIQGLVTLV